MRDCGFAPDRGAVALDTASGALVMDHVGAFGAAPLSVTAQRLFRVALLARATIPVGIAA